MKVEQVGKEESRCNRTEELHPRGRDWVVPSMRRPVKKGPPRTKNQASHGSLGTNISGKGIW